MPQLPEPLERLISELSRLPGVGPKTAQRLAFHLLRADRHRAESLAQAIVDMKLRIGFCERCYNIAEGSLCAICSSARRDTTLLCVVESPLDVLAVERTSEFAGLYFVLNGVISPIDGVGPDQIHVPQLLDRVRGDGVAEVIVATDADIEGEATAVYLQRALAALGVQVTRPAHGLPVGGDLEYADELTLARAISGRRAF
ncbi:MAG: recombination protein RecR [Chloroflexi bacterium]|nr:MAG: recombination protein RecR [Chloroflexota bacterium]TMF74291.1 MAG: recombination protein RecR [Chloroflexota bacterium]